MAARSPLGRASTRARLALLVSSLSAASRCAAPARAAPAAPRHVDGGGAADDSGFAIFSMACNYLAPHLAPFVVTLRASGYEGEVVIGMRADAAREAAFVRAHNVTADAAPCDEAARAAAAAGYVRAPTAAVRAGGRPEVALRFWTGSLNLARYAHYVRWLRARPHLTHAWLLDARDVVFLAHPFAQSRQPWQSRQLRQPRRLTQLTPPRQPAGDASTRPASAGAGAPPGPAGELHLFVDSWRQHCDRDVKQCVSRRDCYEMHRSAFRPNLCMGTVFGGAAQLLAFCEAVVARLAPLGALPPERDCYRNDQPFITHMLWQLGARDVGAHPGTPFGTVRVFDHFHGAATTLSAFPRRNSTHDSPPGACHLLGTLLERARTGTGLVAVLRARDGRAGAEPRALISVLHKYAECEDAYDLAYARLCAARWGVPAEELSREQLEHPDCAPPARVPARAAVLGAKEAAAALAAEEAERRRIKQPRRAARPRSARTLRAR